MWAIAASDVFFRWTRAATAGCLSRSSNDDGADA